MHETILTMSSSNIKYGFGATAEAGFDIKRLGAKRVMVTTDKTIAGLGPMGVLLDSLKKEGIDAVVYNEVRV